MLPLAVTIMSSMVEAGTGDIDNVGAVGEALTVIIVCVTPVKLLASVTDAVKVCCPFKDKLPVALLKPLLSVCEDNNNPSIEDSQVTVRFSAGPSVFETSASKVIVSPMLTRKSFTGFDMTMLGPAE